MRNPKIKKVIPNYRKKVLEITLFEKGKSSVFYLPFSVFNRHKIDSKNKFKNLEIDQELGSSSVSFTLEDGEKGDFPSDFVLYYCDPSYDWSPITQLKKNIKKEIQAAHLSIRLLAKALNTSPSQVLRILDSPKSTTQMVQLMKLAHFAGLELEFKLKKKSKDNLFYGRTNPGNH